MAVAFRRFNSSKVRVGAGGTADEHELGQDRQTYLEIAIARCSMNIRKTIAIVLVASSLAGCGVVDLISKGMSYSNAVAADLERDIGLKPEIGFNWHNGNLQSVTVTFPKVYVGKPLDELANTVREVVVKEFEQTPGTIVLAFSLAK
jgi:hypothetical protein